MTVIPRPPRCLRLHDHVQGRKHYCRCQRGSFQDPMHILLHILRDRSSFPVLVWKNTKFSRIPASLQQHAGSHTHTSTSTTQGVCMHARAQSHETLAPFVFFFFSKEAPWFEHWRSFIPSDSCTHFFDQVALTPVRSLPSPRWQTSASPSVARSFCTVASPVGWSWEIK